MVDPPGEPSVVISTQTTIFHGASYSLNFDDEPQQPLKITYISVADAKKLASKPTGTVAALNPYFLPLSRLKTKNTHSLTPSQSRPMLCSSHDFHIKYPRDEALYVFFANTRHLTLPTTVISRVCRTGYTYPTRSHLRT